LLLKKLLLQLLLLLHGTPPPRDMGVWKGVAINFLKFHPGPPSPTLLCPAGRASQKRPYVHFRGGSPAGQAACGRFYPFGHRTPMPRDEAMFVLLSPFQSLAALKGIPREKSVGEIAPKRTTPLRLRASNDAQSREMTCISFGCT
jgi:hypothetical protein